MQLIDFFLGLSFLQLKLMSEKVSCFDLLINNEVKKIYGYVDLLCHDICKRLKHTYSLCWSRTKEMFNSVETC